MVASNGTDFLVAWLDFRNSTSRDLYGTRVASNGTVVDSSGLAIGAHPNHSESTAVVTANGSDYFVAWMEWDTVNQTRRNLGSRIQGSPTALTPVVDTSSLALSAAAVTAEPGRPVARRATSWSGSAPRLGDRPLQRVGVVVGDRHGGRWLPVTTSGSLHQTEAAIASNGDNYLVVWTETGTAARASMERGSRDQGGTIDGGFAGQHRVIRERQAPAVTSNGTDYFVTWMDYRDINWNIYGSPGARLGPELQRRAGPGQPGIPISTHSAFAERAVGGARMGRTTWWCGGRRPRSRGMSTARG